MSTFVEKIFSQVPYDAFVTDWKPLNNAMDMNSIQVFSSVRVSASPRIEETGRK